MPYETGNLVLVIGLAIVAFASLWMIADVRATAPDETPLKATKNTSR